MGKYTKRHIPTRREADLCKGIKKKAQPTRRIWAKHPLGLDPGPSRDPPDKNQAERAQWRCGSTTGVAAPQLAPLGPNFRRLPPNDVAKVVT